jgi:hypothetical protein
MVWIVNLQVKLGGVRVMAPYDRGNFDKDKAGNGITAMVCQKYEISRAPTQDHKSGNSAQI